MKQWLISKIPTGVLRYLGWRNYRLALAGHPRNLFSHWANLELSWRQLHDNLGLKRIARKPPLLVHKYKNRLVLHFGPENPVGFPEWLVTKPESYGYEGEPDD